VVDKDINKMIEGETVEEEAELSSEEEAVQEQKRMVDDLTKEMHEKIQRFQDESEEEYQEDEVFQEKLRKYDCSKFIEHLAKALYVDSDIVCQHCPTLKESGLFIYDYQLGRDVHIYEQIIYMAAGLVLPSFITVLTSQRVVTKQEIRLTKPMHHLKRVKTNTFFVSTAAIMAIAQGDKENLARFGLGFFNAVDLVGSKQYTALDKAMTLIYLRNGKRTISQS